MSSLFRSKARNSRSSFVEVYRGNILLPAVCYKPAASVPSYQAQEWKAQFTMLVSNLFYAHNSVNWSIAVYSLCSMVNIHYCEPRLPVFEAESLYF